MMLRKILTSSFSLFFAFTLLTTSCEAQLTEEQALANLRQMSAEGRSPSEDYVAGIESRFAGKRTGLLAKLLRAKMKFEVDALLSMPGLRSEHKKALSELLVKLDKPTRL